MQDQTIKPVLPISRTRDVIKKNKRIEKKKHENSRHKDQPSKSEKKGIIDTFA